MFDHPSLRYYGPDGTPIDVLEWDRLSRDPAVKFLARTEISGGREVVTSWLGVDQRFPTGKDSGTPLIFGSAVLWRKAAPDEHGHRPIVEVEHYPTRDRALQGHAIWVARVEAGEIAPDHPGL